jgi:hypothetical protein
MFGYLVHLMTPFIVLWLCSVECDIKELLAHQPPGGTDENHMEMQLGHPVTENEEKACRHETGVLTTAPRLHITLFPISRFVQRSQTEHVAQCDSFSIHKASVSSGCYDAKVPRVL